MDKQGSVMLAALNLRLLSLMAALMGACGGSSAHTPGTPDARSDAPADHVGPTWPADAVLRASAVTPTSATLAWPAADAGTADAPLRYQILRDGKATLETSELTVDVTGLALGEAHVFKVEAGDAAGRWSSDGPETDLAGAPSPPKAPALDRTIATSVWRPPVFSTKAPMRFSRA